MNVDLLCEFGSLNGGEHSILALLPALQKRGVRFRAVAPPSSPLAESLEKLNVETIPLEFQSGTPLEERRQRLGRLLWNLRPELVHANSLSMGRVAGPILASFHMPGIVHLRDIIRLNRSTVADLNTFRRSLAVSEATRNFHLSQGLYGPGCHVLYNGVDLERFKPSPPDGFLHRELGLPPDAKLLAVIGQIGLRKGQDALLDILAPVFSARDDVHLLVVGRRWSSKEETLRFEREVRQRLDREPFCRGEERRVHLLGTRNDIPRLLNELTLLVHPARQEPLGRVLLEAAACGRAVVATDVGGTREIFPDSVFSPPFDIPDDTASARVVALHEPDVFRRAVESLLDDASLRRRLGASARHNAERKFSRETAAENLFNHYEAVRNGQ